MKYAIGLDPGQHGAVALVYQARAGALPTAVGAWGVWGRWPDLWHDHALQACDAAIDGVPGDGPFPDSLPVWLESFPARSHDRRIGGAAWLGLGKRCAGLLFAFHQAAGRWPVEVDNADWRAFWRLPGKGQDPQQRLRQARQLIVGAGPVLAQVRPTCQVDAAEALLIAGAAVMSG